MRTQASPAALLPFTSLVLPLGALVDTAVCTAWLALSTSADPVYRRAIVLQGMLQTDTKGCWAHT